MGRTNGALSAGRSGGGGKKTPPKKATRNHRSRAKRNAGDETNRRIFNPNHPKQPRQSRVRDARRPILIPMPPRGARGRQHSMPQKGARGRQPPLMRQPRGRQRGGSPEALAPVRVSDSSIHGAWKKQLGGLVRWYVNARTLDGGVTAKDAEMEIERMYRDSGCSIEGTRNNILRASGASPPGENQGWIETFLTVENGQPKHEGSSNDDGTMLGAIGQIDRHGGDVGNGTGSGGADTNMEGTNLGRNGRAETKEFTLQVERRSGEGPAHNKDTWNVAVVPQWAVGESFFITGMNRSPLDLSCEMTIDGVKVARNAPVRANKAFAIWPDNPRYYTDHKWRLQAAKRVHVRDAPPPKTPSTSFSKREPAREQPRQRPGHPPRPQKTGQRYNGKRPDYKGERVDVQRFPDAATCGWTFTGSVEASRVEFFEKNMNVGVVKLDFYYTTGTVKTTLDHPTTGPNQLFRRCRVSHEAYCLILKNPRAHTSKGYRITWGVNTCEPEQEDASVMAIDQPGDVGADADMAVEDSEHVETNVDESGSGEAVYYAKNDAYMFDKEGHANRNAAMADLQPTDKFQAWEEAAKGDWACIHAKFFIALAKKRFNRGPVVKTSKGPKYAEPLPVPEMVPIVDVKAAENAVLATKFDAFGAPRKPKARSSSRMERIVGLDDEREQRADPVFEYKLYYRAEAAILDQTADESELADPNLDDEMEEVEAVPLSETLRKAMDLDLAGYKEKMCEKVSEWHRVSPPATDKEEADAVFETCISKIECSQDTGSVDDSVEAYWDWYQKQEWSS